MGRVFISYSHQDEDWKDRLVRQFGVLAGAGLEVWDDRRIAAGADWRSDIDQAIAACDAAVLLISAHFLTSAFIKNIEVPAFLQRREAQGLRVVPLILSPCAWQRIPWLSAIGVRPKDGHPLSGMSEHDAESALTALAGELAMHDPVGWADAGGPTSRAMPRIHLSHLPAGAPHFLGRAPELAALDAAWSARGPIAVAELIAPGGTGKTALLKRWLEGVKAAGWGGALRVFGWSFYSQGTRSDQGDDRQASEDLFLATALDWFEVQINPASHPADKGQALAEAIARQRTLLLLDGLEPLQHPPGPLAGELRAPGLKALLSHLAGAGQPGLCVITSRERVADLGEWVRGDDHPDGAVRRLDLGNLAETDGARLLHTLGAHHAGAAAIAPDDPELCAASREVRGHALTLSLLGRYLARVKGGDIRCRHEVGLIAADRDARGHAARVIGAYETWFARAGAERSRELAALRLLGLFDRPAARADLDCLRAAPPIPGLTEALQGLRDADWAATLANLADCGLATPDPATGALDAHPLVRECLAESLKTRAPDGWREGHRRLYERLAASVPHCPEGLAGLQPLYQAVAHGCLAGRYEEARAEVYRDRILRGTGNDGFYSWKKLGAFGANLAAIAGLFAEPWTRPAAALAEPAQAWLLNEAAFCLRALGRLGEALGPMRAVAERDVKQKDWKNAAISYGNLSELGLSLGRVAEAVADGGQAVEYADRSGDAFEHMANRTTLADALHQQGETAPAAAHFAEAEAQQAARQPEYPLLYSLAGFRYCDLLLAGAERAAWGIEWGDAAGAEAETGAGAGVAERIRECEAVAGRAGQTLKESLEYPDTPLLDLALDHLTLARCALYADRLQGRPPGAAARDHTEQAVTGLRAAGQQQELPRGLLTRAWLRQAQGDTAGARADLAEVERIASRGAMALHLADLALTRARLFHDRAALAQARRLIETHGYARRLPELAAAETAAAA